MYLKYHVDESELAAYWPLGFDMKIFNLMVILALVCSVAQACFEYVNSTHPLFLHCVLLFKSTYFEYGFVL